MTSSDTGLFITMLLPTVTSAIYWLALVSRLHDDDPISAIVRTIAGAKTQAPKNALTPRLHRDTCALTQFRALLAALTISFTSLSSPARATQYEFDQKRTEVRFVYKMAYSTQRGHFTKVSGTLEYDEKAPEKSRIGASISAASLTTGEALVDNELKGPSFFNAAASPVIAFKSLAVKSTSPAVAEVAGELTINKITKPVVLKVTLAQHDDPALKHDAGAKQFTATGRIQRSAFNMTSYQSMVDDEIDIEISAIARPK